MNAFAASRESTATDSFFDRPGVQLEVLPFGPGIPLGIEQAANPAVGIAGAYGAWGQPYDNDHIEAFVKSRIGLLLADNERLNLAELGFLCRHHLPSLSDEEDVELEVAVGARLLLAAIRANGWDPAEVDALLLGATAPIVEDFTERIADLAGLPDRALKVSIHKACDGSVAGLNLALNPSLPTTAGLSRNLAEELAGKKVIVGGLEALSRVMMTARDTQALQLFGNGAGFIGLIPGKSMKFLAGGTREIWDGAGVLQVRMTYPHTGLTPDGRPLEVTQMAENRIRVAGLQHEPEDPDVPVLMAEPMGMVKLFVRNGVVVVRDVYRAYQQRMVEIGSPDKELKVAIAHHANLKINQLKDKTLQKEGICLPFPWLVSDFGNVSAASVMIALLRYLPILRPGDNVLFDGFGAGTYYDVVAVEMGC